MVVRADTDFCGCVTLVRLIMLPVLPVICFVVLRSFNPDGVALSVLIDLDAETGVWALEYVVFCRFVDTVLVVPRRVAAREASISSFAKPA